MLISGTRYLERPPRIDKSRDFVEHFFANLPPGLFRQLTRMEKASFSFLLSLINDHPIFKNDSRNPQAPVIVQLAVALDRFGHEGNGACLSRSLLLWGLGHESLVNYTKCVMLALESRLSNVVSWPDVQQRRRISSEFAEKGFPGCVGLIDGTLLSLSQRPRFDGETYFDRKQNYSMNAQIVCDLKKRVLFLFAGMPGSCHDSTCLKRSPLWKFIDFDNRMFEQDQYLLADSGYTAQKHLVSSYGMATGDRDKQDFNTCIAHARMANEHCIGILKSRWHSLKRLRTQLKRKSESKFLCRWISCCIMLHNFLLIRRDEWSEADGELEVDADSELPGGEISNSRVGNAFRDRMQRHCLAHMRSPGGLLHGG